MRKPINILLCIALLLCSAPFTFAEDTSDLTISTAEAFLQFAERCRLDSYSQGLTVALTSDIDLTGTDFSCIPIFCGTFLGNGHTITGLSITADGSEQGLFRYLTQTAIVQDLNVSGTVTPGGSRSDVGGIAGNNAGVIKNCSFSGEVAGGSRVGGIAGNNTVSGIIENCRTSGAIHGNHFVGGTAGENSGVIRSCESNCSVNTTVQQNNVDISDITIGTITGTESASTVTDIGGIAGSNSGIIRMCKNLGDVGYKHIGYNIGGIAGSQIGFLTDCENSGAISGRKDIGGIVGHMEPAIKLTYETDALQLLETQMSVLSNLVDRAVINAKTNTTKIRSLMAALQNHASNAETAIDILTIDPEAPELKDADTYTAALQTLGSSIAGIETTLRALNQALSDTGDDLETDLNAIADQTAVIEGILNSGEEHLGGSLKDISDADTEEDLTSKVAACKNSGSVLGDINIGGIVGVISLENDLDPEEDILITGENSLNITSEVRSVILSCANSGSVTAKKQNAGGIIGWQSLGLVKDCIGAGILSGADYAGGIAGRSLGYIRACSAKGSITGNAYVGGIAGSGTVVSNCHSIVMLSGTERIGAILGFAEENYTDIEQPIIENLYIITAQDPGAIDGISYAGKAEPTSLDSFLASADVPENLKTVSVTFLFEDGTSQVISLQPGCGLDASQIPEIPKKEGYSGSWGDLDQINLNNIFTDISLRTVYTRHGATIGSDLTTEDGRPILFIQGSFPSDALLTLEASEQSPPVSEKETLLESWSFTLSNANSPTAIRYLIPDGVDPAQLQMYVCSNDGSWDVSSFTVSGSYAVISVENNIAGFASVQKNTQQIPWLFIGAAIIVVATAGITAICLLRKKKVAAPRQESGDPVEES